MTNELASSILQIALIPLLTALTAFIVGWLRKQAAEIETRAANANAKHWISLAEEAVERVVSSTSQTYCDELKRQGAVDEDAQNEAFRRSKEAALASITIDAKAAITEAYGGIDAWLDTKIQQSVRAANKSGAIRDI
jgi:peptide subunit release factor 1 (eRF1)